MGVDNNVKVSIGMLALAVAISQIGVEEQPKGSNKGPAVNRYLASVGLKPGYAWCQGFVYWCYAGAALQALLAREVIVNPVPRTAGVRDCWNKVASAMKVDKLTAQSHPERILPGAQFFLDFGGGKGHTGIVERVENGVMHTIEGNSNNTGSREGYAVVRHTRRLDAKELLGVVVYG